MFHVEHEAYLRTNVKREIDTYGLQLGDHLVFVDRGTRAEDHWLGLGYQDSAAVGSVPGEPGAADGVLGEKPKRRGRKPAVADEVVVDE